MTFLTSDEQLERVVKKVLKEDKAAAVNPEKLYTQSEAARLLGKSYPTIGRMIQQKRIVATFDGKYISQRAIDNYLDGLK
jgi:excisionase family DNA binding protein